MATFYSDYFDSAGNPKQVLDNVDGISIAYASYTSAAAPTATDIVQMVAVPNGARIIDGWVSADTGADGTAIFETGLTGVDADGYTVANTATATYEVTRFNGALLGSEISLSDDAVIQYETIDLDLGTCSATVAAGANWKIAVIYQTRR